MKAIVIDEHPLIRLAVSSVLNQVGFTTVIEADNGVNGIALVRQHQVDLVVMDVELPGISGLELMDRIYAHDDSVEILIFTAYPAEHYYGRCRAAHASGFLSKTCTIDQMMGVVNRLVSGHAGTRRIISPLPLESYSQVELKRIQSLSSRELSIFVLLARGMANVDIARRLLISNKSISTYKSRLMAKLQAPSVVHLSNIAQRNGLIERVYFD